MRRFLGSISLRELLFSWPFIFAIGFLLRIISILLLGSYSDGNELRRTAASITLDGISAIYHRDVPFPYLPLNGLALSWIYSLALRCDLPFGLLLRLPSLVAEGVSMLLVVMLAKRTLKYAASPGALMAYAGSIVALVACGVGDAVAPVGVMLILGAVVLLECASVPLLCGAILGLAMNLTPVTALVVPALVMRAKAGPHRGYLVLGLLPWMLPLVIAYCAVGMDLPAHLFGTQNASQAWGPAALLVYLGNLIPGLSGFSTELIHGFSHATRILTITLALGLAWLHRSETGEYPTIKLLALIITLCVLIDPYKGSGALVLLCSALWCLHSPRAGWLFSTVFGAVLLLLIGDNSGIITALLVLAAWGLIVWWFLRAQLLYHDVVSTSN